MALPIPRLDPVTKMVLFMVSFKTTVILMAVGTRFRLAVISMPSPLDIYNQKRLTYRLG